MGNAMRFLRDSADLVVLTVRHLGWWGTFLIVVLHLAIVGEAYLWLPAGLATMWLAGAISCLVILSAMRAERIGRDD